jgi:hypothetical protein
LVALAAERTKLLALLKWRRGQESFRAAFTNFDDAFLNVSLLRSLMLRTPVVPHPEPFVALAFDRFRLERMYASALYVLTEAWLSPFNMAMVQEAARRAPDETRDVTAALRLARRSGLVEALHETRDYMSHRDRRQLYDPGRLAVIGTLYTREALFAAYERWIFGTRRTLRPPK